MSLEIEKVVEAVSETEVIAGFIPVIVALNNQAADSLDPLMIVYGYVISGFLLGAVTGAGAYVYFNTESEGVDRYRGVARSAFLGGLIGAFVSGCFSSSTVGLFQSLE